MKIIVTKHAKKRILRRINCREDKVLKIVKKAWYSKDKPVSGYKKSDMIPRYKKRENIFKYFLGKVFVFSNDNKNVKILVTVINI